MWCDRVWTWSLRGMNTIDEKWWRWYENKRGEIYSNDKKITWYI